MASSASHHASETGLPYSIILFPNFLKIKIGFIFHLFWRKHCSSSHLQSNSLGQYFVNNCRTVHSNVILNFFVTLFNIDIIMLDRITSGTFPSWMILLNRFFISIATYVPPYFIIYLLISSTPGAFLFFSSFIVTSTVSIVTSK